MSTVLMN